jgi:hypothetical protein
LAGDEESLRLTLQSAVGSVLDSVAVEVELNTLITMALTYLHQRYST